MNIATLRSSSHHCKAEEAFAGMQQRLELGPQGLNFVNADNASFKPPGGCHIGKLVTPPIHELPHPEEGEENLSCEQGNWRQCVDTNDAEAALSDILQPT